MAWEIIQNHPDKSWEWCYLSPKPSVELGWCFGVCLSIFGLFAVLSLGAALVCTGLLVLFSALVLVIAQEPEPQVVRAPRRRAMTI